MAERRTQGGFIPTPADRWEDGPTTCYVIPAAAVRDYGRQALEVLNQCVCMQPWNSVTGRTCPVHGHIAPMQITC